MDEMAKLLEVGFIDGAEWDAADSRTLVGLTSAVVCLVWVDLD